MDLQGRGREGGRRREHREEGESTNRWTRKREERKKNISIIIRKRINTKS